MSKLTCSECVFHDVPACKDKTTICDRFFEEEISDDFLNRTGSEQKDVVKIDQHIVVGMSNKIEEVINTRQEIINGKVYTVKVLKPVDDKWVKMIQQQNFNIKK